MESREPIIEGQTLTWGPYHLPAAGNKAHNPFGIHTMMHDCGNLALHLEGAKVCRSRVAGGYPSDHYPVCARFCWTKYR